MKSTLQFLLVTASIFAGTVALAQQETQGQGTDLRLIPVHKVYCQQKDYPMVSTAFDIENVNETSTTATFKFLMRWGRCEANKFYTKSINVSPWVIQMQPARGEPKELESALRYQATPTADDEIAVLLTVDKKMVFAGSNEAHYMLYFLPTASDQDYVVYRTDGTVERDPRMSLNFPWHAYITKNSAGDLSLAIRQ